MQKTPTNQSCGIDPGPVFVVRCDLGQGNYKVAVKDVINIAGFSTKAGSKSLEKTNICLDSAVVVDELLKRDCSIIGKTTLHELAYGVTGLNEWAGTPVNVEYPSLIPGGSSSGSAVAVSAKLCDFSIGTDTGGSVRVPAACCGVYGLKPTYGRISREGLTPAESSLDCVGPLAASADMLLKAIRAMDPSFRKLDSAQYEQVGWIPSNASPVMAHEVHTQITSLGISPTDCPVEGFAEAHQAGMTIIASETYAAFSDLLETGLVGGDVAGRLAKARDITPQMLSDAELVREKFTISVDKAFERFDILALPTLPDFPPRIEDASDLMRMVAITSLCRPFNLSGHPAIAVPLGKYKNQPVSLQLVAPKGEDERLVAIALEIEHALASLTLSKHHQPEAPHA
jgi:amidase